MQLECAGTRDLSRRHFVRLGAGALAAPLILGCGSSATDPGGDPPEVPDPRLTARPGIPTLTPTFGSSQLGLGGVRDGWLYVPTHHTPATPMPLFLALHGSGGGGHQWESYGARAEQVGMIVLAPDSRAATWDVALGGFGPDVAFLDAALRHTFDRCRIDPTRIAFAGFSDGASYALSLGVSNGDLATHLVAHSPGFFLPSPPVVGRPRVFVSHGTDDAILPVTLSRDSIVPTFRDSGYEVLYREFTGGHEVPPVIAEEGLNWFLGVGGGS